MDDEDRQALARERYKFYRDRGYEIRTHDLARRRTGRHEARWRDRATSSAKPTRSCSAIGPARASGSVREPPVDVSRRSPTWSSAAHDSRPLGSRQPGVRPAQPRRSDLPRQAQNAPCRLPELRTACSDRSSSAWSRRQVHRAARPEGRRDHDARAESARSEVRAAVARRDGGRDRPPKPRVSRRDGLHRPRLDGAREEFRPGGASRRAGIPSGSAAATSRPASTLEARRYSILLPPPNVTGTLHMGHAFQQTLMDALTRYHRMRGFNTLWQPGTDHAGIATQIVVERQLEGAGHLAPRARARGVRRARLEMEGAVRLDHHAADAPPRRLVRLVARALHDGRGALARRHRSVRAACTSRGSSIAASGSSTGTRCCRPRSPTSRWRSRGGGRQRSGTSAIRSRTAAKAARLIVATTRPETMLGDVAVAVHPEDERYRHLDRQARRAAARRPHDPGHRATTYVDPEFGTGCVKITPAHDFNDYQVGLRHGLPPITIFTLDARRERQRAGRAIAGSNASRRASASSTDLEGARAHRVEIKPHKLMRAALRAHRRGRRADAHRPVVRRDGIGSRSAGLDTPWRGKAR